MELLNMSIHGAVLILIALLIYKLTGERVSAKARVMLSGFVFLSLVSPVRFRGYTLTQMISQERCNEILESEPVWRFWRDFFWIAWGIGCVIFLSVTVTSYWKNKKLYREAIPVNEELRSSEYFEELQRRKICVKVFDRISSPVSYGILKPVILIPKNTEGAEQRYMIAHELAHISNHDMLRKLVALVILGIHWFNPIVWGFYYVLLKDMELACDAYVLNKIEPHEYRGYARTLLSCKEKMLLPVSIKMGFSDHALEARMRAILNKKNGVKNSKAITIGASLLILSFLTVSLFYIKFEYWYTPNQMNKGQNQVLDEFFRINEYYSHIEEGELLYYEEKID